MCLKSSGSQLATWQPCILTQHFLFFEYPANSNLSPLFHSFTGLPRKNQTSETTERNCNICFLIFSKFPVNFFLSLSIHQLSHLNTIFRSKDLFNPWIVIFIIFGFVFTVSPLWVTLNIILNSFLFVRTNFEALQRSYILK